MKVSGMMIARVLTVFAQAALLLFLAITDEAMTGTYSTALNLLAVFVPTVILLGLGHVRPRGLAVWAAAVSAVVLLLAWHEATRGSTETGGRAILWVGLSVMVFVGNVLFTCSIGERRILPAYSGLFETAWRHHFQIMLSALFVCLFWSVLWLGSALFSVLGIEVFYDIITSKWFYVPATCAAFAVALQTTDVRPTLIQGARTVVLALLSIMLPVLAGILLLFLAVLAVEWNALWKTGYATALFMGVGVSLVILINAAYQDGEALSRLRRLSIQLAALELVVLTGLSVFGLTARVAQYGWTEVRVFAAAALVVLAIHAAGYAAALFRLKWLEITNVAAAYAFILIGFLLLTPIADPARIMVASQMQRLKAGTVTDPDALKAEIAEKGARWGKAALASPAGE